MTTPAGLRLPPDADAPLEVMAAGRFVELRRRGHWEYAARVGGLGAAFILAVTAAEEIVLVEQYRVPVGRRVIELPAGVVGDHPEDAGEGAATAAQRELEEETGYRGRRVRHLVHGPTAPGLCAETLDLFEITDLEHVGAGGGADDDEDITVHVVKILDAPAWLRQAEARGLMVDPRVYAGLWFAEHREH
ncbi:MAG: NUDIX hydrolase [Nevskiaceae bacterium]|nr:MAG: NUDIX hydrolase [Nevskiaceae bacterium]TBR71796.1 MAG: NUDIX hydrolase [Nevskiaceae bacterium]